MSAAPRLTWEGSSIETGASFSECGRFRYDLTRTYDARGPWCLFIGLNPSTADAQNDDPTIRREIDFAHGFGYPNLAKCNLFALRSTDPAGIVSSLVDPTGGPENDEAIARWVRKAGLVLFAWGSSNKVGSRLASRAWVVRRDIRAVVREMPSPAPLFGCLGTTKEGQPKHPLYLSKETPWPPINP